MKILNKFTNTVIKLIKSPRLITILIDDVINNGFMSAFNKIMNAVGGKVYNYRHLEYFKTLEICRKIKNFEQKPLISILMIITEKPDEPTRLMINSIKEQFYTNWELCIIINSSGNADLTENISQDINELKHSISRCDSPVSYAAAMNKGLEMSEGDYITFIGAGDEFNRDSLYLVVNAINEQQPDLIYSDEDQIALNGMCSEHHFKPDYSPEMIMSFNYLSRMTVFKKEIALQVGGFREGFDGAEDYDLLLRFLEKSTNTYHIHKILYHWRKIPYSKYQDSEQVENLRQAEKKVLQSAIERRKTDAIVEEGLIPGTYRIRHQIKKKPLISIIIPFKDKPELLEMCVNSIIEKSTYSNFQIIGINNNSIQDNTVSLIKKLTNELKGTIEFLDNKTEPFNFPSLINSGANFAKGEQLLFLNNDIEIITSEWIESMLEFSQLDNIGVVGAKLYFPDNRVQHAGVILNLGGIAAHSHKFYDRDHPGYFNRLKVIQNLSAVTAACMMVKKTVFNEMNGFDEQHLPVNFNDVDFCLRVREKGYYNVFTPFCEAYHHESVSRGEEDTPEKQARFVKEIEYFQQRHGEALDNGDPYYNFNLTVCREDFSFRP